MILLAHLFDAEGAAERRGAPRVESGAVLSVGRGSSGTEVLVLNLSKTGLRLQSTTPCAIGEVLNVEIPGYPAIGARVVWQDGQQFGCEFETPLSRAAMSAFILRSPVVRSDTTPAAHSTEIRLGSHADDVAGWIREFEAKKDGRTITGFRVDSTGEIIAIIAKPD